MTNYPIWSRIYYLVMAFLLVSTIPTFSGKLMGDRISREWVPPLFGALVLFVGLLISYPYPAMTVVAISYLVLIPLGWRQFHKNMERYKGETATAATGAPVGTASQTSAMAIIAPSNETKH